MNERKIRVLVVDDDPPLTRAVKLWLETTGEFEVRTENFSQHALQAAEEFSPDIMVLDSMLPEMVGGMLVDQFREKPRFKHTPIIFLAWVPSVEPPEPPFFFIGGGLLLAKPFNAELLVRLTKEQLARSRSSAGDLAEELRPLQPDPHSKAD